MRSFPINAKNAASPGDDGELDLLQIFETLLRGKWTILFWMLLLFVIGCYYVFRVAVPVYTTTATVAMHSRSAEVVELATALSGLGGDLYTVNTEVETLAARDLVIKLVNKLDLVADPVFNEKLRPEEDTEGFSPGMVIGRIASVFRWPGASGPELTAAEKRQVEHQLVVDRVLGSIKITAREWSYVFYITVTTEDPAVSARVANGLAKIYIEDQIAIKYQATEQATAWLNDRVADLRVELEASENAVKAYSAKSDLIGPEVLQLLNLQLKDRRGRVLDAETAAQTAADTVQALEAAKASGDPTRMVAAASDPALNQIAGRLDTEGARAALEARFDRILERARFEAGQAATKIAALESSVSDLAGRVEQQSAELLKLEQLEREAAANRQLYEYFLGRLKEISVQQGIHRADSRILSKAMTPLEPSAPRKTAILAITVFVGLLIGAALVLLREMRHSGFRSPQDLEMATGQVVFAQIPRAPVNKRSRMIRYLTTKPASAMAEAVRNLRTSVMLSNVDEPPQVIMLTSPLPGEGKTTQSLALSQSFASMGRRVLLIEGDIRRLTFKEYFRTRNGAGLISAVMQDRPLSDVVQYSDDLGIDILAGERSTANAADFFSSARVRAFFNRARAEYDIIIIDTPPVLVVPDARVIGQLVDAVLYVVHWNRTTRVQALEGLNTLATVDVKVSGLVLSQVDIRKAAKYGRRYLEIYAAYGSKYYDS